MIIWLIFTLAVALTVGGLIYAHGRSAGIRLTGWLVIFAAFAVAGLSFMVGIGVLPA